MNNGLKIFYIRLLNSSKIVSGRFGNVALIPKYSTSASLSRNVSIATDSKLIRKGDFRGVTGRNEKIRLNNPDIIFSRIQENLRRNYRVSADMILLDVVRPLEENNEQLENLILRSPERWIPMILSSCGHPMSNIEKTARNEVMERLWTILEKNINPMPIYAWNTKFQVLNENEVEWNPTEQLDQIERQGIEPNLGTFHRILTRIANSGDVEGCRNMVYNMARRGFAVDEHINASSVFVFSVRGHYKKADSLIQQAATKYGENGERLAHGAAVRAAAYRGDNDRLRQVLRKSVDGRKKLIISNDDLFETIWQMAQKSRDGSGAECSQLVEQMLNCTMRGSGFFRKLYREIERHICHRHYYTALSLLEDTKRVSDCLENQQRSLFLHQLVGRLSSQLIRHLEPIHLIRDIANRVHFTFNSKKSFRKIRMYDDLLFATVTLKEMKLDDRLEYFRTFVDEIDPKRERIHVTVPLLTSEEELDQRLVIIYRSNTIGYKNWSNIDIDPLINFILQPIYNSGRPFRDQSKLDKVGRILKSYGIDEKQVWMLIFNWSKRREIDERYRQEDQWIRPFSRDLRGWCKAYYSEIFENPKPMANKPVAVPYEKLKACVEQGDIAKVSAILANSGTITSAAHQWPKDTNFEEIVPKIINLYLNHETWKNAKEMLANLSANSSKWDTEAMKHPIRNYHFLMILRRFAEEGDHLSIRNVTDYAYELRNLFPNAICYYEGFFETQTEYKKLFAKCFERLEKRGLTPTTVDELIDFLRCLVKLDIIQLHPSETLTVFFINTVLKRVGWDEALNTWQKFLSGLHCPNGTVALLRHCVQQNNDVAKKNLQFVIHRGSTFLSKSRIAAMHTAVLIGMRKYDDAEKACDQYEQQIEPNDCLMAMRLMNSLKARSIDEQFMLDFAAICLRRLKLAENREAAQNMQADLLRICDFKHMGPTALRVYQLFSEYDVKLRDDEKNRLAAVIEKHTTLSNQWLFKPNGFLNLSPTDEIITKSDEAEIEKKLKLELAANN